MAKKTNKQPDIERSSALPQEDQSGIINVQKPFDSQFGARYDSRFLKGKTQVLHFNIDKITDIIPDGEGGSDFSYYVIGTGNVYNCHFGFSIVEVGMSWTGTPALAGLGLEIEKLRPGESPSSGTLISFFHQSDDFLLQSVITPVNPVSTLPIQNSSPTTYNDTDQNRVNFYKPANDATDYAFRRKDRIGINFTGDPADLGDIESICLTIKIIEVNN